MGRRAVQQRRLSTKNTRFGESYNRDGLPQSIKTSPKPTSEETLAKGVIPELDPLFRWETSQPGNVLRVFERGGHKKPEIGNPNREEDPGKPDEKLSDRGFGTGLRTDPVFLGLQKTRLLDPILSLPGTNDHPGDYRGSGCTACHVVYANDRDPSHSAAYAQFGHSGFSASSDPTIPKNESGHPVYVPAGFLVSPFPGCQDRITPSCGVRSPGSLPSRR